MTRRHPYGEVAYAEALGEPFDVPAWGTALVLRPLPGGERDAVGPYPRAPLPADADLSAGLGPLREAGLVSLVLVTDPLTSPPPDRLAAAFDRAGPFKTHRLIDPAIGYNPTKHHRDRIRRGLRRCRVEEVPLIDRLDDWARLYAGLVERRAIEGTADFSDAYFAMLAGLPTLRSFAAFVGDELVAMTLWLEHVGCAYSHLTATNALGFANGAAFALNDAAIAAFPGCVVDLGGGAGVGDDPADGLAQFKQGFANRTAAAWLCGAILDPTAYARLAAGRSTAFFPAYRG